MGVIWNKARGQQGIRMAQPQQAHPRHAAAAHLKPCVLVFADKGRREEAVPQHALKKRDEERTTGCEIGKEKYVCGQWEARGRCFSPTTLLRPHLTRKLQSIAVQLRLCAARRGNARLLADAVREWRARRRMRKGRRWGPASSVPTPSTAATYGKNCRRSGWYVNRGTLKR